MMALVVPEALIEESVAVTVRELVVFSVTPLVNVCAPLSPVWKV